MLKINHLISSKSLLSRLPSQCKSNSDCLYDSYCSTECNQTSKTCQMKEFHENSLDEFCSLISSLIIPESNQTFLDNFNPLLKQCQEIITDGRVLERTNQHTPSLDSRRNLLLQNLRNLLWRNIEYQMNKITKKSTRKPATSANAVK